MNKVCTIDSAADQRLGIGADGLLVGYAVTAGFHNIQSK